MSHAHVPCVFHSSSVQTFLPPGVSPCVARSSALKNTFHVPGIGRELVEQLARNSQTWNSFVSIFLLLSWRYLQENQLRSRARKKITVIHDTHAFEITPFGWRSGGQAAVRVTELSLPQRKGTEEQLAVTNESHRPPSHKYFNQKGGAGYNFRLLTNTKWFPPPLPNEQ